MLLALWICFYIFKAMNFAFKVIIKVTWLLTISINNGKQQENDLDGIYGKTCLSHNTIYDSWNYPPIKISAKSNTLPNP